MAVTFPVDADISPASKHIDELVKALQKAGREAGLTEKQIDEITKSAKQAGTDGVKNINNVNKGMGGLGDTAKKVGGIILATFALDRVIAFGKEIISVTSEFQKFEAVLTNTLGSKSAAQRAIAEITAFAAKTPFSVRELTESFVKLANQGFKPTAQEMRKLGDLASSTGKQFDQLTEAIIDAQTGEFERLKEFGIRASKAGDQVTFTFKGVQTQTEFTSQSIRDYVLSLGDAVGVTGAMAAISETTGGKISNMGDAWGQFLKTLGDGQTGPLNNAINNITLLIGVVTEFVKTKDQLIAENQANAGAEAVKQFEAFRQGYKDINEALADYNKFKEIRLQLLAKEQKAIDLDKDGTAAEFNAISDRKDVIKAEIIAVQDYVAELTKSVPIKKAENKQIEDLAKNWKSAAEKGEAYRKFLAEMRKAEESDATKRISDSVNKSLKAGVGGPSDFNIAGKGDVQQNPFTASSGADQLQQQLAQESFDFAVSLIGNLADIENAQDQADRQRLQEKYSYELSLAGNNEEAKLKLKRDFDAKDREIQNRQAQRSREAATFDIVLNTSRAVISALASTPPNVPLSIFAGATGLLQLARVNAQKLPRFAEGVYGLNGPGTETSDSILSLLSKNESVVPAHKSRKFGDILKPMIEDDSFGYADMLGIVNKNLPSQYVGIARRSKGADSSELIEEMKATRKAIENKRETRFTFDEDGFGLYMGKQNDWTKYVSKRYSM